jgi:uncharacterized protein YoxC
LFKKAARIKQEAQDLLDSQRQLLQDVNVQKTEAESLLQRGKSEQQMTDEMLTNADAAYNTARQAVAQADQTLREANEVLKTLRGQYIVRVSHTESYCSLVFYHWEIFITGKKMSILVYPHPHPHPTFKSYTNSNMLV